MNDMTTQSLTLTLPQPILEYLRETAAATQQSLEQVALQSLEGNLPPTAANAPPEMQAELLAMQTLPVTELKQITSSQIPPAQQARHLALLERNKGDITPEEREELIALRLDADRLMLRKAYAWAVLRWRGQSVPALNELPLD
jgi:hypothetical protein